MIQSLVSSPGTTTVPQLDALLQVATNIPEAPDFAALLAQSAPSAAVNDMAPPVPAALPTAPTDAAPVLVLVGPAGNPLPPPWPDLAGALPLPISLQPGSITTSAEQPDPAAEAAPALQPQLQAAPATRPRKAAKATPIVPRSQPQAVAKTSTAACEPEPAVLVAAPQPGEPDPAAKVSIELPELKPALQRQSDQEPGAAPSSTPIPMAATVLALPASPGSVRQDEQAMPAPAISAHPRSIVPATPDPAAQAVAHAAPQAAFQRAVITRVTAQSDQPAISPDAPQPAVREPGLLRVELALPGAAAPVVKGLEQALAAPRRTVLVDPASAAAMLSTADRTAAQPTISPATPAFASSPRPHDFAALVDRLVAAREAVQPQGATLIVAHTEFGPVELRFRHEAHGLAVSLASADPDFARAAAAAPPVNLPVSTATFVAAEPGQSAPSRDTAASFGGNATGQSRGQQSERRDEGAQQFNHGPHRPTARESARRSGIFA